MRLLLVEDKETFRRLLVQALAGSTWSVLAVGDPQEALEALERSPFEILVTDLRLPGITGLELLRRAKRMHPDIRIVLMSAFGEPKDIVEAIHSGADDFLPKPFDLDLFISVLDRLLALVEAPPPDPRELWITHSPAMRGLDLSLSRAAEGAVPVLFHGEPGTGKSRSARRLHTLRNPQGPFLATSASGLEERRLRLLANGSIYLTDLENLSPEGVKLLLGAMESEMGQRIHWMGGARSLTDLPENLRLRLGVLCFALPPLAERRDDVLPLFRAILEVAARREGRVVPIVERMAERELLQRSWPGNIRELSWCAEQALRMTQGTILASLPTYHGAEELFHIPWPLPGRLETMLAELEKSAEPLLLRRALEARGHDLAATAVSLGLTTRVLAQRLREYMIPLGNS